MYGLWLPSMRIFFRGQDIYIKNLSFVMSLDMRLCVITLKLRHFGLEELMNSQNNVVLGLEELMRGNKYKNKNIKTPFINFPNLKTTSFWEFINFYNPKTT